jgi:hypothetical protein
VFDRMVSVLDSETKLRSLQVVSRETPAAYRVRSYLAAEVVRGKTVIAWVWDVYDRDQQRALRLSGEEAAATAARDAIRDPWAAADDLVLRRIAQAGLSGLSGMINGAPPDASPPASPGKRGPAVASAGGRLARFRRIPCRRARLHRPVTTPQIPVRIQDFGQENPPGWVASAATGLISPRSLN